MKVNRVGIDLAKNVFQICALNQAGTVVFNRRVRRAQLMGELAQLDPTTVAMEACSGAHYWGRRMAGLGHRVLLIPPQHCKAFVRGGKSDSRDALGIAEAAGRPRLKAVPVKSIAQQDLQLLLRQRQRAIRARTELANQIRAVAREYGVTFHIGIKRLRTELPQALEDADNALSPTARLILAELQEGLAEATETAQRFTDLLIERARANPHYQRLQQIPGIGPVIAAAVIAAVGNARHFANGRGLAAWLGLVPRQYGTGGRMMLMGITKQGDRYLRTLFIHGARAALRWALRQGCDTPLARWARPIDARRGRNRTVVALANKMARISWVILATNAEFEPHKAFAAA